MTARIVLAGRLSEENDAKSKSVSQRFTKALVESGTVLVGGGIVSEIAERQIRFRESVDKIALLGYHHTNKQSQTLRKVH